MLDAPHLLREAAELYDGSVTLRTNAERNAWRGGFSSGAEWMRLVLAELRGQPPTGNPAAFAWLGTAKYALASLTALVSLLAAWWVSAWLAMLVIPAFYAVEVQWVFLFPVALDGSLRPWHDSRALMRLHSGTLAAMTLVLPFAWRMLTGGFCRQGFVRSWCIGCLAVVLWYERCRKAPAATTDLGVLPKLDIAQRAPLFIRHETLSLPLAANVRLLYISDLHLSPARCGRLLASLNIAIESACPQLIILGGDLVDKSAALNPLACQVRAWADKIPVIAIPGNHDRWVGEASVRTALAQAGAHWLPDAPYLHRDHGSDVLWLADPDQWPESPALVPTVAVLHDPSDFSKACTRHATLALAGHLHGCQVVLAETAGRLLPGAWFYRWNGLRFQDRGTTMIVSRGCADTLPLRWNCPREVLVCDLKGLPTS